MGRWISNFDTTAEFATFSATTGFSIPHVVLTKDNNQIRFFDIYNGHAYVDLGLPSGTLWATENVLPIATNGSDVFQYGKGANSVRITSGQSAYSGTENPLARSADTAAQLWGGGWHMPTQGQFNELIANTTYEWTVINRVEGGKFTAQNGNYVFFGTDYEWKLVYVNVYAPAPCVNYASYMASTPNTVFQCFKDTTTSPRTSTYSDKKLGYCVRPVIG